MQFRKWVQVGAFPIVAAGLAVVLFRFPGAPLPAYTALVLAAAFGAFLEQLIPVHPEWNVPRGDTRVDATHAVAAVILGPLTAVLVTWMVTMLGPYLPSLFGAHHLPVGIEVIGALVVSGFFPYWLHRLSHTSGGILWRAHSIHHSAERVYWLNSLRLHPLNIIWNSSGLFTALLFGFSAESVFIAGALNNFISIYNHLNADLRIGPLNWIFNMNELHRWHHSRNPGEGNANYSGGALNVWDTVFGTRRLPPRAMRADAVGLFDADTYPARSYTKQLLYPLCQCGMS